MVGGHGSKPKAWWLPQEAERPGLSHKQEAERANRKQGEVISSLVGQTSSSKAAPPKLPQMVPPTGNEVQICSPMGGISRSNTLLHQPAILFVGVGSLIKTGVH